MSLLTNVFLSNVVLNVDVHGANSTMAHESDEKENED